MIHYHGGPITPQTCAYRAWAGRHAFISYANPEQIDLAAAICQSFALDNGAFSRWKSRIATDWRGYYDWSAQWLAHPACDFAIIPDVIGGTEEENDMLLAQWPHGQRGVPVWHLNESPERLQRLAASWPRLALGSAAAYDAGVPRACLDRLYATLPAICDAGVPRVKLHGLRMLRAEFVKAIPLASADSTNVARNIGLDDAWQGAYMPTTKELRAQILVERIEQYQSPGALVVPVGRATEQLDIEFELEAVG